MIQFQENPHKEWKEGWKDGQTLYYRTLLATPRGATSTTTITASQSAFKKSVLEIQSISGSCDQTGHTHF